MFSWKPFYIELGEKLLAYRDRQGELLAWLHDMKVSGLPVLGLVDQTPKGTAIDLTEIDPFTFFANFNRGIKDKNRIAILRTLKERMGLSAPVPQDFEGIPLAMLQGAWFFPYAFERDSKSIPLSWKFAEAIVRTAPDSIDTALFEGCLQINTIGVAKLTMGMFWLQPDRYLALDQVNRSFLQEKYDFAAKDFKIKSLSEYLRVLESVRSKVGSDLADISFRAYVHGRKIDIDPTILDQGFRRHLEKLANAGGYASIDELVKRLMAPATNGENEITNRTTHHPVLAELLGRDDYTADELKSATDQIWALTGQQDSIRRAAFFKSPQALEDIRALLDDDSGSSIEVRINNFIEAAFQHGYAPAKGQDRTAVAQFASVLLSSKHPDLMVDFRKNRWNALYKGVTDSNASLVKGSNFGQMLVRAGSFAAQLTKTPTFVQHFGNPNNLWTVAGVAWQLKDGPPKVKNRGDDKKVTHVTNEKASETDMKPLPEKNIILYGPPGTGKTHALRTEYMDRFTERGTPKTRDQFADEMVAEMAWWEVSTLVMLDLKTARVTQILEHPLMKARIRRSATKNARAGVWAHLQMHTKRECENVAYAKRYEPLIFSKSAESVWSIDAELANSEAPELVGALEKWKTYKPSDGDVTRRCEFTTFHQSYSYEEFVEGIKPILEGEAAGDLVYEIKPGIFRQIAQRANNDLEHNYAIFIDEINRGNIASIFGELITLLEEDKRLGEKHEIKTRLPYSREEFGVPPNLYVIGTMNTADRSVEALDAALRRRFAFIPYLPNPMKLPDGPTAGLSVDLRKMLTVINNRLERLLDRDHCIGHSYFIDIAGAQDPLAALRCAFANKVVPLLEEYFYGDPGKIGLVLGSAFVKKRPTQQEFASCDWDHEEDEDGEIFERANPMDLSVEAFEAIYA